MIRYNGKEYEGKKLVIKGNELFIDGVKISEYETYQNKKLSVSGGLLGMIMGMIIGYVASIILVFVY